jgi:signal transduction histidine kinase
MCLRADDALVVDGSKDEIAQLIMNLLSNAVDAVREQGVITVRCKGFRALGTGRPTALISFADTGPGIQKVHRPMLFEPFFTTKKDIGTGLGLWIVRDIVHKHGGLIRIRTRTHGKRTGTVISVLLPCDDAAPGAHLA